jgi:two-component system, NarL family, nitrate/nitrite response regulator NarL
MKVSEEGSVGPLRIMLIEDHISFRQALAYMLDQDPAFEVVAQAGTIAAARRDLDERKTQEAIDAAIIDLALPDGNGADLIGDLRSHNPHLTVLVLSATLSQANVAKVVHAGVDGVLDKLAGPGEIIGALRRVVAGAALPLQQEVVDALRSVDRERYPDSDAQMGVDTITPREREVLRALAEGLDSEEIAERLGITVEEEHAHVAGVLVKLGARTRLQALAVASRLGVVEIG